MRSAFLNIETGKQLIKLAQAEIEGKTAETEKLMALHAIKVNFEDMLKRERTVIILEPFVAEYVDGIRNWMRLIRVNFQTPRICYRNFALWVRELCIAC